MKDLLKRVDVECVRLDQCCIGLKDIGIMTNSREIAERLNKRCNRMHEHEPIAGGVRTRFGWRKRNEFAEYYSQKMVNEIIAGYLEYKYGREQEAAIATIFAIEVFSKEQDERKIMQTLKRCHENLGHPSNDRLIFLLKAARANEGVDVPGV